MIKQAFLIGLVILISGCDEIEQLRSDKKGYSYSDCIRESFAGGHNYTADDVRSLCEEITDRQLIYEYKSGKLVPKDDFTKCYESRKAEIDKKDIDAEMYSIKTSIAELECKRDN